MGKKRSEFSQDDVEKLLGVSRREFLYYCGGLAGSLALVGCGGEDRTKEASKGGGIDKGGTTDARKVAAALTEAVRKQPVIWLSGQECTGCSIQFLNIEKPTIAEVILDKISLRYHEAIMAASGSVSERALEDTVSEGGYVLVVEGSIPGADDRFCEIGGKPFRQIVLDTAAKADVVIAIGSCASFGGIPGACPSQGKPVSDFVKDKPIINLPHCPVHHEHLLETIVFYLTRKAAPELDDKLRPKMFFSKLVHDQCARKKNYDEGNYLNDWNDPKQKDWCLAEKGCKGSDTYSDCVTRKYNGGVNHCLDCGSPCQGCAEPSFYGGNSPLYAFDAVAHARRKEALA